MQKSLVTAGGGGGQGRWPVAVASGSGAAVATTLALGRVVTVPGRGGAFSAGGALASGPLRQPSSAVSKIRLRSLASLTLASSTKTARRRQRSAVTASSSIPRRYDCEHLSTSRRVSWN